MSLALVSSVTAACLQSGLTASRRAAVTREGAMMKAICRWITLRVKGTGELGKLG